MDNLDKDLSEASVNTERAAFNLMWLLLVQRAERPPQSGYEEGGLIASSQ